MDSPPAWSFPNAQQPACFCAASCSSAAAWVYAHPQLRFSCQPAASGTSSLNYNIQNCSLFLPLISTGALGREEGYFRKEWKQALARNEGFFATHRSFIIPIIIDEGDNLFKQPHTYPGFPPEFYRDLHMYHCPSGKATTELISCLHSIREIDQAITEISAAMKSSSQVGF